MGGDGQERNGEKRKRRRKGTGEGEKFERANIAHLTVSSKAGRPRLPHPLLEGAKSVGPPSKSWRIL